MIKELMKCILNVMVTVLLLVVIVMLMSTRQRMTDINRRMNYVQAKVKRMEISEKKIKGKKQPIKKKKKTKTAKKKKKEKINAGCRELTAYIATGNPCADGKYPKVGYTVASNDKNLWHKWVEIEGLGTYYVHDRGGMAVNVIDIFMGSYDEAITFGRQKANVYILE